MILSGADADGAIGIARIKEQGGVTFVQSPEDAEYDDMPRNAIASGQIDFVLPVAEIPDQLMEWWRNERRMQVNAVKDLPATCSLSARLRRAGLTR